MHFRFSYCLLLCCVGGPACRPAVSRDGPLDTETDPARETGRDTRDTGETGDSAPPVVEGVQLQEVRTHNYEEWGYELATFGVVDGEYMSLDGELPLFYVVRPAGADAPGEPLPLLVWFHGGHIGDDSSGVVPQNCGRTSIDANIEMVLGEASLVTEFLSQRQWALLLPRNDWCDGGFGRGVEDPVDPQNHWGYRHLERSLDWVLAGNAGVDVSGPRMGWGTSAGGAWAVVGAHRYGGFSGLVLDSAACDSVLLHGQDARSMEHIFGGAPDDQGADTEAMPRYLEASCTALVAGGDLAVPTYVAWNNEDLIIPSNQPSQLVSALQAANLASGLRYGAHNFAHGAPSPNNHVQTRLRNLPWAYSTEVMYSFLEGKRVLWREVEGACAPEACPVGAPMTEGPDWANYSGGGVVRAQPADGVGRMAQISLPPGVPFGQPAEAVLVAKVTGLDGLAANTQVLTVSYSEGEDRTETHLAAEVFAPATGASDEELVQQVLGTRLVFTPTLAGTISVRTHGVGEVALDSILLVWTP